MSFSVEKDIMVPMRDGVRLATDVWVPAGGGPAPVLLVRLPKSSKLLADADDLLVDAGLFIQASRHFLLRLANLFSDRSEFALRLPGIDLDLRESPACLLVLNLIPHQCREASKQFFFCFG